MKVKHGEHSGSLVTSPLLDFRLEEILDVTFCIAYLLCTVMAGAEIMPGFASF